MALTGEQYRLTAGKHEATIVEVGAGLREYRFGGVDVTVPYGEDVLPQLLSDHGDEIAEDIELPRRLLDELGAVPSYYLRYFYAHDAVLREQLEGEPRAAVVQQIERSLLDLYRDPAVDERPDLLMQRGGAYYSEAALGLISSLATDDGAVHEVDVRNDGTLAGLAADDVVEVPARVGREGVT